MGVYTSLALFAVVDRKSVSGGTIVQNNVLSPGSPPEVPFLERSILFSSSYLFSSLTLISLSEMDDSLVARRSKRSTAGNRMEAALAEFMAEDIGMDVEEDADFTVAKGMLLHSFEGYGILTMVMN